VVISHTTTDLHGDEGYIQRANVSVKLAIQHNQQLYISIWAVNQVCLFGGMWNYPLLFTGAYFICCICNIVLNNVFKVFIWTVMIIFL